MARVQRAGLRAALPIDAAAIAHVYVESWRSAYRGVIPAATLAGMSKPREAALWRRALARGERAFVVENGSRSVVGFAAFGPERGTGRPETAEIYTIYLLPGAQRQGLGRRLMAASAEQLLADGFAAVCVWVLRENRFARMFYEGLGGALGPSRPAAVGPVSLTTVRYDWCDLRRLEEAAARISHIALPPFLPPISHST